MTLETVVNADLEPFFQTLGVSAICTPSPQLHTPIVNFIGLSLQSSHSVSISSPMITPWPNLHTLALNDNKLGVGADIGLYLLHQVVLARTILGHRNQNTITVGSHY
jgi:hypothetical protein